MKTGRALTPIAGCTGCHGAPKGDIRVGSLRFNHEDVQRRGVACQQCHLNVIDGEGAAPRERCFTCHNQPEKLKRYDDHAIYPRLPRDRPQHRLPALPHRDQAPAAAADRRPDGAARSGGQAGLRSISPRGRCTDDGAESDPRGFRSGPGRSGMRGPGDGGRGAAGPTPAAPRRPAAPSATGAPGSLGRAPSLWRARVPQLPRGHPSGRACACTWASAAAARP